MDMEEFPSVGKKLYGDRKKPPWKQGGFLFLSENEFNLKSKV
jgi:hypothetical protein